MAILDMTLHGQDARAASNRDTTLKMCPLSVPVRGTTMAILRRAKRLRVEVCSPALMFVTVSEEELWNVGTS